MGVCEVLENQLQLAEREKLVVKKIILTGGFGQSPTLQSYLRTYLKERTNLDGLRMHLVVPNCS
jgi:actin-related protein